MDCANIDDWQRKISACFSVYKQYSWLLNCYVLDFFTENHWDKLSKNWQTSLKGLSSLEISKLLDYEDQKMRDKVWPLSILALKTVIISSSLPRKMMQLNIESPYFTKDEKLLKLFWKNVKAKKRHEISIMSKICYESALKTDCFYIVDVGSGLGHLSRMLNYGYGFKVCTVEAQESLSQQARILDNEFETTIERNFKGCLKYYKTVHVNKKIEPTITAAEFLTLIKSAFDLDQDNFKFGIVGLHPCGDLGATLLKLYMECNKVCFINVVGCCYMKLTTLYHSREIACHAIENYIEKLRKDECWRLKIHTYRALLEKLIAKKYPQYHHCALNNVKYSEDLSFESYCRRATKKLPIDFSDVKFESTEIDAELMQWREVVVFYSLRLLFAPLIESIILLDRFLYVIEGGSTGEILSVFDAKISPRSHILTARKKLM